MIRPVHARYPFLKAAREAVAEEDPDIVGLVSGGGSAAFDRAFERVEAAVRDGSVGERATDDRVELLSYPLARILASATGENIACTRLADAEAANVRRQLSADAAERGSSVPTERPPSGTGDRELLAREFGLGEAIAGDEGGDGIHRIGIETYLPLAVAARDDRWSLRGRTVDGGEVAVDSGEIDGLLAAAAGRRVGEGLPVDIPDPVAEEIGEERTALRTLLDDVGLIRDIDTVVPDLFPPCMTHILGKIRDGERLEHHSRFAVTAFLTNIGMDTDEIVDLYTVNPGFEEEMTRYQVDHIAGNTGPIDYDAPACATMKSHGDCHAPDETCETISHPVAYYGRVLDDADADEIDDWRDRPSGDGNDTDRGDTEDAADAVDGDGEDSAADRGDDPADDTEETDGDAGRGADSGGVERRDAGAGDEGRGRATTASERASPPPGGSGT